MYTKYSHSLQHSSRRTLRASRETLLGAFAILGLQTFSSAGYKGCVEVRMDLFVVRPWLGLLLEDGTPCVRTPRIELRGDFVMSLGQDEVGRTIVRATNKYEIRLVTREERGTVVAAWGVFAGPKPKDRLLLRKEFPAGARALWPGDQFTLGPGKFQLLMYLDLLNMLAN